MKRVFSYLLFLVLFALYSCDDEPLDSNFFGNNGGEENPTLACQEATQVTADASLALVNATTETYETLCNDFATALQAQINACGDSSGALQATLYALDCGSSSNDDCANATLVAQAAQSALANASTENYSTLCNSYAAALQAQINACGDDTGELQAIINGLECENTSNMLLPRKITETYIDGSTTVTDFTFDGNRLIKEIVTYNFAGETTETDVFDYTYENDLLVRIDETTTDPWGNPEAIYSIFEYDSNNRLISETIHFPTNIQIDTYAHNADGTITFTQGGEEIYIYTFENGNLINEEHTNGSGFYVHSYDDKNSYGKNIYAREIIGLYSKGTGNNNLVSSVDTGDSPYLENENYTYTYNSDNYPISANVIYNQGTTEEEVSTIEYLYY